MPDRENLFRGKPDCVYLTYDGYCILHSVGSDVREPCVEGPCGDERLLPGEEDDNGLCR